MGVTAPAQRPPATPPSGRRPSTKPAGERRHVTPATKDEGSAGPLGVVGVGRTVATRRGVAAIVVAALVVLLLFPVVASRWARLRG